MVDLESVLKKEGTYSAKILLEQYHSNFVGESELTDLLNKVDESREYILKDGFKEVANVLNETNKVDVFSEKDFEGARLLETPSLVKSFKKEYGVICPTVSIVFPKDHWGNGLWHRIKAFFKGYKTIIKKLGYSQDLFGMVSYYGFYMSGEDFKPNGKLFLEETGLSFLEDGDNLTKKWAHEALHAAYRKHARVNSDNLAKNTVSWLNGLDKMLVGETIIDMSLLDEMNARRPDNNIDQLDFSASYMRNTTPYYYLSFAVAKYNKYAEANGITPLSLDETNLDFFNRKLIELSDIVRVVEHLAGRLSNAEMTRILFTSAPTKSELGVGGCHSPFRDLYTWKYHLVRQHVV
ncbi:hypothetical protein FJZ53_04155 [Candidatus Woesearchaeota archaeon]|nr:hypothetical protein [Candidatus Woesearchaeota archaeon]